MVVAAGMLAGRSVALIVDHSGRNRVVRAALFGRDLFRMYEAMARIAGAGG